MQSVGLGVLLKQVELGNQLITFHETRGYVFGGCDANGSGHIISLSSELG
jgi:hypothetical protein